MIATSAAIFAPISRSVDARTIGGHVPSEIAALTRLAGETVVRLHIAFENAACQEPRAPLAERVERPALNP